MNDIWIIVDYKTGEVFDRSTYKPRLSKKMHLFLEGEEFKDRPIVLAREKDFLMRREIKR